MNIKQITTLETIDASDMPFESKLDQLKVYLDEGYEIVNFSCTHTIKQNTSNSHTEIKEPKVFINCSYLLNKK